MKEKEKKKKSPAADLKTTPCGYSPCLKDTSPHYQIFTKKLSPIDVQRVGGGWGGIFSQKRSLKMIQKHLCSSTLDLSFFLSLWSVNGDVSRKKNTPFHTCPQFNSVIIWASIESFSATDARCNSFNALGS